MPELRLGAIIGPDRSDTPATVAADDLTTHGVIVGMTGSGKTGLGAVLVEECLRAGIPALLIDPKGDLANLALTFSGLTPEQFAPWINPSDAAKAGQDEAAFAAAQAQAWRDGLAPWGLGPADVQALHDAAPVTIYTPGAAHGVQLNIIGSLDVPADTSDAQAVTEEIDAYVGSLLHLLGIDADPLSSREHILLSTIIADAWRNGRALDMAGLLAAVQQPPFRKVGVLELEVYYPVADRMKLAMRLNGLLASPAFASWLDGERIDIESMLHAPDGRPRCAVVTTAHLSDDQRQSVTAVILAKLTSWMRRQPGTTELRALLYLDEVAGYLPPVGNPPTKAPIMLLLKQARAFGVGVVLATQNPVDIDYKALSNAGTWMIGRLQTEQDKARLVAGLTSAAGTIDPAAAADTIAGLGKRQFLLKRAGAQFLDVFTTRWAMSYLRGPLTRDEIARLRGDAVPAAAPLQTDATDTQAADTTPVAPRVATGIPVHYLDPAASWSAAVGAVPGRRFAPAVIARVNLRYDDTRASLVHDEVYEVVRFPMDGEFIAVDYDDRDLLQQAPQGAHYDLPLGEASAKAWWNGVRTSLTQLLIDSRSITIPANPDLKLYGRVGESEQAFATRCAAAAAAAGDRKVAHVAQQYQRKIEALQRRIDLAGADVDRQRAARTSTLATDVVSGLFGRRTSFAASARRAAGAGARIDAAQDKLAALTDELVSLQAQAQAEIDALRADFDALAAAVTELQVPLERSDVQVTDIGLLWIPVG